MNPQDLRQADNRARTGACRWSRRPRAARGTVMILVVALLGVLFVAGVAFLQMVTFQSGVIQADADDRQDEAIVDAVEGVVFNALKRGFLADDGIAYSGPPLDASPPPPALPLPTYGEELGTSPLLAAIEPYRGASQVDWLYGGYTNLQLVMADAQIPYGAGGLSELSFLKTRSAWESLNRQLVDADGDGMADALGFDQQELGTFVAQSQWKAALDRFHGPDATDERLIVGARVIANGGMANVIYSHLSIVQSVLSAGTNLPNRKSYVPEIEERALRHRNFLPARELPRTVLQAEADGAVWFGNGVPALLGSFPEAVGETGSFGNHRWWPFDATEQVNLAPNSPFTDFVNPTAAAADYDRRHLLTTASFDDLLIRGVRFPAGYVYNGKSLAGRDITDWLRNEARRDRLPLYRDNYPHLLRGASLIEEGAGIFGRQIDARVGRVQLSLSELDKFLADKGKTINTVDTLGVTDYNHFVGMIQDTFWLMLMNADLDGNGNYANDEPERSRLAASLTANLIDFADSDDVPTDIYPVSWLGVPAATPVFGLERQPYISELHAEVRDTGTADGVSDGDSIYAVELFNPYNVPLSLVNYKLNVVAGGGTPVMTAPLGGSIPAGGYVVVVNKPAAPIAGVTVVRADKQYTFVNGSTTVDLIQTVATQAGPMDVIVDSFRVSSGPPSDVPGGAAKFAKVLPSGTRTTSVLRDDSGWKITVPVAVEVDGSHTLMAANNVATDPVFFPIRPVQVDFANQANGLLADTRNAGAGGVAYPTTGCLLLLMRHANEVFGVGQPFTRRLVGAGVGGGLEEHQIDNGRMPIFDIGNVTAGAGLIGDSPNHHVPGAYGGSRQGVKGIPWGQLVFDYFTALPLTNDFDPDSLMLQTPTQYARPKVDQSGLRVYGRININAGPEVVLEGLPLVALADLPAPFQAKLATCYPSGYPPALGTNLGFESARAVVAYREAREVPHGCSAGSQLDCTHDYAERVSNAGLGSGTNYLAGLRSGRGFLTIGELANVRHPGPPLTVLQPGGTNINENGELTTLYRFDSGIVGRLFNSGNPAEDYVRAVSLLVALGDWVTTRSHVFTVYGTIRGSVDLNAPPPTQDLQRQQADARAIRFEETVNRLPCFFDPKAAPQRIGERVTGQYLEARSD